MGDKITRETIARMTNTSVTAVSRVINNSGYVARDKREAILAAVKETGYRSKNTALNNANQGTKQILFVNKDLNNTFTIELYRGMVHYASKHGYTTLLSATLNSEKIKYKLFDGVIIPNNSAMEEYIDIFKGKKYIPAVCASYGVVFSNSMRIPLVDADSYIAMEMMIDYLFRKGHRKIALATPHRRGGGYDQRYTAYHNKMAPVLGDEIEDYIFSDETHSTYFAEPEKNYIESGKLLAQKMFEVGIKATAVCCFNDDLAIGLIQQFGELGVCVPEDISVAGIDGIDMGNYTSPRLTTVSLSPFVQGSECVRILLDVIQNKKVKMLTNVPISITERNSVKVLERI